MIFSLLGKGLAWCECLEISEQSEIGKVDIFRISSLRAIELALSGSSEN